MNDFEIDSGNFQGKQALIISWLAVRVLEYRLRSGEIKQTVGQF